MQFLEKNTELMLSDILARFPYLSKDISLDHSLDTACEATLIVEENVIKLSSPYSNPVSTNIESVLDYHKVFFFKHSVYKEPLARALGLKKGKDKPVVLDATAGMLGDTLLIYSFGCKVQAYERSPVAYILSKNAIENNGVDIDLSFGDAIEFQGDIDVIYFDPMYEVKNDKALPKKEMRIFREVVGSDPDAKESAKSLLRKTKRLVIKRSIKAQPLLENPEITYSGKSTSYDVYVNSI